MMYLGVAATVAALVLPLILLYKFWLERRSHTDDNATNNSTSDQLSDSNNSPPSFDHTDPSSLLSLPMGEYEVFLSFRGPDTRDRITDIIYRFLLHLKIHTFKDDEELRQGERIWSGLIRAIDQCKIYVPILSKTYAHSIWCLKELAEIVQRSQEPAPDNKRPVILPIFYKVDPRDVRHQTGAYKEAFQQHEKNFDQQTLQEWKNALTEIGSLKGWHVKSDNEQGKYADLVLDSIWACLRRFNSAVETDDLVAIDGHVEEVVKRLSLDSKQVTMVGLHGIGGIGKTTLAKASYNKILHHFDRCSFVENIRETQQQKDGILTIQKKIIGDVMRKGDSIVDVSEGRRTIMDRVSRFKVLIVLDDVDEKFNFDEILGNPRSFAFGSRFIITSRNSKVLSTLNEDRCELYDVQALDHPHSLQLFSMHAFKKSSPPPDYEILSNDIVATTGGLPLTLKVVGSLLHREGKSIWKEKLIQLREMSERDVIERLKISYDALEYEAKEIFLDIACLYIGENKEMPCYMWSDCHLYPTNNINLLIQRSMVEIEDDGTFQMHDQLRDMGVEIVRRENIEHPWMRSRIWQTKTARELLHGKKGTDQVKAISFLSSSSSSEHVELESECFVNLSGLRYFEAPSAKLCGDFDNLLPNLRWLRLFDHGSIGDYLINFYMKNLIILELCGSNIGDDWGGWTQIKTANKLKVLDLSDCDELTKLPKLPESGSLEVFNLPGFKGRTDREKLDIGKLRNLKVLNLRESSMKKMVGGTIGMMEELRELDVSFCKCENLGQVLVDVGRLQSLQILSTSGSTNRQVLKGKLPTSLKELFTSSSIKNLLELIDLEVLEVYNCRYGLEIPPICDEDSNQWWKISKLKTLSLRLVSKMWSTNPNNSLLPPSLASLELAYCVELKWLPNLENLGNLTELIINYCPMPTDIQGLGGLKSLKNLVIENTDELRQLEQGLDNLRCLSTLKLSHCGALVRLSSLESLTHLGNLQIQHCPLLTEIQGIGGLVSLKELDIESANSLIRIDGLGNLFSSSSNKLESLRIWNCPRLASLSLCQDQLHDVDDGPSGPRGVVKSLETISIQGCKSLLLQDGLKLPHLSKFPMLQFLTLADINVHIHTLEGLHCLEQLGYLTLGNLPSIEKLPPLSKLGKLKILSIRDIPRLHEIQGLADLKSSRSLRLVRCTSIERIDGVSSMVELEIVVIRGCTKLQSLPSLSNLRKLRYLAIEDMSSVREIDDALGLAYLTSLEELDLRGCTSLERLTVNLPLGLKKLNVRRCTSLTNLSQLKNCLTRTFIEDDFSDDGEDDFNDDGEDDEDDKSEDDQNDFNDDGQDDEDDKSEDEEVDISDDDLGISDSGSEHSF